MIIFRRSFKWWVQYKHIRQAYETKKALSEIFWQSWNLKVTFSTLEELTKFRQGRIQEEMLNENVNTNSTFSPDTPNEIYQDNKGYFFHNPTQQNLSAVQQPNFNNLTGNYQSNSSFETQLFIQQQRLNYLEMSNHGFQNPYFGNAYH